MIQQTGHPAPEGEVPHADIIAGFEDLVLGCGAVRIKTPKLWELWNRADPAWAGFAASRPRLHHTLQHLHATGVIKLPSPTGRLWDSTHPRLPLHVDVPANRRVSAVFDATAVPWTPTMGNVAEWIRMAHPSRTVCEDAVAINRWLLATAGSRPPRVAREERSLHIFNDEKRLADLAGSAMFDGRLTLDDLACDSPRGAIRIAVLKACGPVLVVENKATFDSAWRALDASLSNPSYAAVVFGSGDAVTGIVEDLVHVERLVGLVAARFDYAGDVDIAGVEAAAAFAAAADRAGLPWAMATRLWHAVAVSEPVGPDLTADAGRRHVATELAVQLQLPGAVSERLHHRVRVPQERIDRAALARLDWWRPLGLDGAK